MNRLAPISAALLLSACATQLDTASLAPFQDELKITLQQVKEDACPTIDSETRVRVNGSAASFSDRGGGSCRQVETSGSSIVTLAPTSSKRTIWSCVCHPALLQIPSTEDPLEVELCPRGGPCARAVWPAQTPMPLVTPEAREGRDSPLIVTVRPAVPARDLQRMMSLKVGEGDVDPRELIWSDGQVTISARWANEPGLTVRLRQDEDLNATTCEGLSSCDYRPATQTVSLRINP